MIEALRTYCLLLRPKTRGLLRMLRPGGEQRHPVRLLFFGMMGFLFAYGIYRGSAWFLHHVQGVELVGALIPGKLLSLVLLILASILLLSSTISAFSVLFLSEDLTLLTSAPVAVGPLFFARFTEMAVYSAWMVIFFGLPVFLAYGTSFAAGPDYYLALLLLFPALLLIPAALGAILATVLTRLFSARRSRDLMILLVLVGFVVLYLTFRALRPERLLEEESFGTMVEFLAMFQGSEASWLPTTWMTQALLPLLQGKPFPWLPAGAVWSTALALCAVAGWVGGALYPAGVTRAQEGRVRFFMDRTGAPVRSRVLGAWLDRLAGRFAGVGGPLFVKDLRVFFRDPNQWLQLLLLGALAAVYLLNFVYLKVANFSWFTLYTVNHVLIGLVLSGVAVRFVFPAVSLEGRAWWIVRTSPVDLKAFLHAKLLISFIPLAAMGLALSILSCLVIGVPLVFVVVSTALVLLVSLGVASLGVGIGALFPRFNVDNPAKIPTGLGGVTFMIISFAFVIGLLLASFYPTFVLQELPHRLTRAPIARVRWFVSGLVATGILGLLGTLLPMWLGRFMLSRREE